MVQDLISAFGKFKSVVAKDANPRFQNNNHQGIKLNRDWEDFADGRILSGEEKLQAGICG